MVATALLMSFGTTSPRYSIMQAMYFPALGRFKASCSELVDKGIVDSGVW